MAIGEQCRFFGGFLSLPPFGPVHLLVAFFAKQRRVLTLVGKVLLRVRSEQSFILTGSIFQGWRELPQGMFFVGSGPDDQAGTSEARRIA